MLFLTVAFFFSTISLSGGIYPDEKCFQAAKNSICFKYYPLQFKNCVATLSPYYDKIKLDICQSDEYPDHCVDVVAVCMDYREALVYAPGYPSDQEYEVLPTKYYYWGLALSASAGVFFILHVLFSVWLKRRGSSQGGAENNERPIIRTQPRGVEPPPSYETLVPRQSRWRTLHHMCSCGCNNSEEDRVLNQFAPSAPSAPVDESLQNRAPLPPPRTRRRRQVPADQQLPAEQQLPADQLPADQQLADQQLADQQVADQQVADQQVADQPVSPANSPPPNPRFQFRIINTPTPPPSPDPEQNPEDQDERNSQNQDRWDVRMSSSPPPVHVEDLGSE